MKAQACPLFVPLAEEGWIAGDVPHLVAREYLADFARDGVDTLVLGCTHYPLLKGVIAEVVGPDVALVDSAEATAEAVAELLAAARDAGARGRGRRARLLRHGRARSASSRWARASWGAPSPRPSRWT